MFCLLCSLHTELLEVPGWRCDEQYLAAWLGSDQSVSQCDVIPQARGGREGQMVTRLLTIPPVRSQPGICVSLY